ncbi:LysE type translocator [mine drainage metagenome]|uniref:LysE type translocator n=1 Tax=mine drainage metagenome TaxID=410659 RepID=A0A1J5T955_9ZZZZ
MVSFLGQLPLGTMSITSTHIAVKEGFSHAWKYALGVALIEIIYLRTVLSGVDLIMQHHFFFVVLGWLTVVFFLGFGVYSFITAVKHQGQKRSPILNNKINRFWLGITMSALNPAQIPFWFIWSSYLINLHVLHSNTLEFNTFTIGCGSGTISGLAFYMYGGNWVVTKFNTSNKTLDIIMGIIFIIAAAIQFYRMVWGTFV